MDPDIRPISQTRAVVHKAGDLHRDSWRDSPKPAKGNLQVEIETPPEEIEVPRNPECSEKDYEAEQDDGNDWRLGFKHQFPWIGFAGLLTIIFATAVAVHLKDSVDGAMGLGTTPVRVSKQ